MGGRSAEGDGHVDNERARAGPMVSTIDGPGSASRVARHRVPDFDAEPIRAEPGSGPDGRGDGGRRKRTRDSARRSPGVFGALGHLTFRFRWLVLAGGAAFLTLAILLAMGVFGALNGSGFVDPASESARANQLAATELPRVDADVVLIYTGPGTVNDLEFRAGIQSAMDRLPDQYVSNVDTYYSTGAPQLVSADQRSTLVLLRLVGADEGERLDSYGAIKSTLADAPDGFSVQQGGTIPVSADINEQVERDITRAELLSFPILLVLLVLVLGGFVAAGLPLLVGAVAIVGALAFLRVLTLVTDVSVFTINIVTMLGLGLAIDYSLLIVSRFRRERRTAPTVEAALVRTLTTAGRTVAFSSIIVTASLAALLVYPQVYFRSMAWGGMAAAGVAAIGSLTVLPAMLAVLGGRVDLARVRRARATPRARHRRPLPGFFFRVARVVMRRPVIFALAVLAGLLVLASPFSRAQFGDIDWRALPDGMDSKTVAERVETQFPAADQETVDAIVVYSAAPSGQDDATLDAYAAELGQLPGATSATVTGQAGAVARVSVTTAADPSSSQAQDLVTAVRGVSPPPGSTVLVGGSAARVLDLLTSLRDGIFPLVAILVAVTSIGLFLAFGSIVLPIKAMLLSVLSLAASWGVIVWIFQQGHLSGLLGFTPTGTIEPTQLVLMLVVTFALSTDYEVFMLSRVREEWDATGDNQLSVARGLQGAAPIVTSAGLLLLVVIGAFSTSGIVFIKMIGVGMIIAIVLDATVIRAILVPATMRLLGAGNWWAPGPLRRWWVRHHRPEPTDPGLTEETTGAP